MLSARAFYRLFTHREPATEVDSWYLKLTRPAQAARKLVVRILDDDGNPYLSTNSGSIRLQGKTLCLCFLQRAQVTRLRESAQFEFDQVVIYVRATYTSELPSSDFWLSLHCYATGLRTLLSSFCSMRCASLHDMLSERRAAFPWSKM